MFLLSNVSPAVTIPALPNAELAVMELLWQRGRSTGRQIIDQLYPDAPKPQHGTVQRLLQRLASKGFVLRDRSLGISVFSPAVSRDAYASAQLESLANRLTQGSLAPMITRLVADNKLSQDEIEKLHRILEEEI